MRITNNSMIRDFLAGINLTRERLNKLQLQLATQKRISKPSDDPDATSVILRTDMELGRVEKFTDTITSGKSLLEATTSTLDRIASILQEVKGIVATAQGQTDPGQLGRLGDQVNGFLDMALEIANTEFDGKYIFGGTKTTVPPYVRSGSPQQVVYNGNSSAVEYQIGAGVVQQVSIPGSSAFGSNGVIALSGTLDRNAGVGTTVTNTVSVTDGSGTSHAVQLTFEKTAANTWKVFSAMPPGAGDAAITGGTAVITFDPVTGNPVDINRGAPLTLTPVAVPPATDAAAPLAFMLSTDSLAELSGPSTTTAASRQVDVFNKLLEIRDGLRVGRTPSADDMYLLGMMNESVARGAARAGAYAGALDNAEEYNTGLRERLLDIKSANEDVDLAEIGIKLRVEQTALEAALSTGARIIPQSLLDFLK